MSTDLKAIMERDERRRQMLNDPDLTGELLLFAFAVDEINARQAEQSRKRRSKRGWVAEVEEMVCPPRPGRASGWWVKERIGSDIPRYEFADAPGRKCVVPVTRRSGKTDACGGTGVVGVVDRDPLTGEGRRAWFCKGHKSFADACRARTAEWQRNGKPSPPPNAGGVLERYYGGDWDALYRWAKPWKEPLRGEREATPPRPVLRLIEGGVS